MKGSALICGTVRDVEKTIFKEVQNLDIVFSQAFDKYEYCIVESDSADCTIEQLYKLKKNFSNFNFLTLGALENKIPSRVERIAHCRNQYLDTLLNFFNSGRKIDHLVVIDLDSINNKVRSSEFNRALSIISKNSNIGGVFPNQLGPYYDIYALRHSFWNPSNSSKVQSFYEESLGQDVFSAHLSSVLIKMITIPPNIDSIEVESAFGGMAIYSAKFASKSKYDGKRECEHVAFNKGIRDMGKQLFILPFLINSGVNNHSFKRSFFYILYLLLRSKVKKIYGFILNK
jgi:hypothetical protein